MWENKRQPHQQKQCKVQITLWRHTGNGGIHSTNWGIPTACWIQQVRMVGFSASSSGTENNGTKRTICRNIFNLATEDPGTKYLGGVQNLLTRYVWRTRRHQQVDIRECGICSKFSNGIRITWQNIGCGNGNLMAIMSSDKSQVEMLLVMNAPLS